MYKKREINVEIDKALSSFPNLLKKFNIAFDGHVRNFLKLHIIRILQKTLYVLLETVRKKIMNSPVSMLAKASHLAGCCYFLSRSNYPRGMGNVGLKRLIFPFPSWLRMAATPTGFGLPKPRPTLKDLT